LLNIGLNKILMDKLEKEKLLLIKTEGSNNYLISRNIPQVLLLNPILNYLLELYKKGIDLKDWLARLKVEEIQIADDVKANKEELGYYYEYIKFLEHHKYFKAIKRYNMSENMYTAEMIKTQLANTQQIVFEVTDSCSLRCSYCGYGDLYYGYDKRYNNNLTFETARKLFDYMIELFKSSLNRKSHKRIAVSFYGGEPLLNMPLIKKIVMYAKKQKLKNKDFFFSLTTNAVALDKHMDFLAKNNFLLLISLDGNEKQNSYRVFPDGSSSYKTVYNNILALKKKYPEYFDKSVNFMAVLHDRNSHKDVVDFFNKHFGKEPIIAEVNSIGIKAEKQEEFKKLFKKKYSGFSPIDIVNYIKDRGKILKTPFVKNLSTFIHRYSGYVFKKYDQIINKKESAHYVHTGTCNPFEKKIFITTNGKILPCERILQTYHLGKVDEKGVHIDFQEIANKYNLYYKKILEGCNSCACSDGCSICIFTLNLYEDKPGCEFQMGYEKFETYLQESISLLEETPKFYSRIMRDYQVN